MGKKNICLYQCINLTSVLNVDTYMLKLFIPLTLIGKNPKLISLIYQFKLTPEVI